MKLVPMGDQGNGSQPETKAAAKKTMYRSTMNPNEVSDKPGKDSMGMDMVPFEVERVVREDAGGSGGGVDHG